MHRHQWVTYDLDRGTLNGANPGLKRREEDCLSLVCFRVGEETKPTNGRCSQPLILRIMGGEIRHMKDGGAGSSGRLKMPSSHIHPVSILRIPRDWRTSCNTARRHALTLDGFFRLRCYLHEGVCLLSRKGCRPFLASSYCSSVSPIKFVGGHALPTQLWFNLALPMVVLRYPTTLKSSKTA